MSNVILKSTPTALAIAAAASLAACSLSGRDLEPPPALYVYKYQQLWLTPEERELAQCWNGGALICAGGLGRLSTLLCQCPLNELY
jgi:hypothetical protein